MRFRSLAPKLTFALAVAATIPAATRAQEPYAWRDALVFHTFSIAAIDPRTGEVGVAVTTRVPCVGNGVPWVRKGVGAVATQASTRTEYGNELLDALAIGEAPASALKRLLATAGKNYVTQGNILVGPEVIAAVAKNVEASDKRHGLRTSAAVVVADSRSGMSRRTDGQTVNINVCENADPVGELRRIYDAVSQTLGYRALQEFSGGGVSQFKVMLNALGFYKKGEDVAARGGGANLFTAETVIAGDAFRTSEKMGTPLLDVTAVRR